MQMHMENIDDDYIRKTGLFSTGEQILNMKVSNLDESKKFWADARIYTSEVLANAPLFEDVSSWIHSPDVRDHSKTTFNLWDNTGTTLPGLVGDGTNLDYLKSINVGGANLLTENDLSGGLAKIIGFGQTIQDSSIFSASNIDNHVFYSPTTGEIKPWWESSDIATLPSRIEEGQVVEIIGSFPTVKEKLDVATAKEQKDGRKLRAYIDELGERQGVLIKKNLDGFISDMVLKQQLDLIEKEITDAQIKLASLQERELDFNELLDHAEKYLENPSSVWKTAKLDKRLKLQWFEFPQGLTGTPNPAHPFYPLTT